MTVDWLRAFPRGMASAVTEVSRRLPPADFEPLGLITQTGGREWPAVTVDGEPMQVPYRIYNEPLAPTDWTAANEGDRTVLACMYSRHNDGHVRQSVLPHLLSSRDPFVSPFLVQLVGEYVLEIIVEIARRLDAGQDDGPTLQKMLREFAQENPGFIALTEARALSYWAEFYRRDFLWARDYPGLKALSRISG